MSITRVWIDENCICCGLAGKTCPEVFKAIGDLNTVIEGVDLSRFEDKIKEAADECPVQAIKFE